MKNKKLLSLGLAVSMVFTMTGCGSDSGGDSSSNKNTEVPTIDKINVGEDYKDLSAKITILTDRTDIVDSVYKRYAEQFIEQFGRYYDIAGIIDNNESRWGEQLSGIEIFSPGILGEIKEPFKVFICIKFFQDVLLKKFKTDEKDDDQRYFRI